MNDKSFSSAFSPWHGFVLAVLGSGLGATAFAGDDIVFNRDVRPILSEYCYVCHGPDANHREADLRLDEPDAAVEYVAIVPGEPKESSLVERIFSESSDSLMPPGETGKALTDEQKERLVAWIRQGASYQKHWSFEPVPDSVAVPNAIDGWSRNPIDHFVAEARREKDLPCAKEADRATWLRRVTFDLTGLPPTLSELDDFLQDDSIEAYEEVVSRLLATPAYGERMANMWLDVARYADTFGYQNDVAMEVWPWRQWVINAFNRNMPYDEFITAQIAGDLLPGATQDQRLATTFNRLHRQTNEGGSIPEEFRLAGINDRTTTAGTAFLGLTLECCRCHDHKFDPIKQSDFYRLSAYFSDIDELGLYSHFTFSAPTPAILLYEGQQREAHQTAKARVGQAEKELQATMLAARKHWQQHAEALISELPEVREPVLHMPLEGDVEGIAGRATLCDGDGEIACDSAPEFGRNSPFTFSLWVNPATEQSRMVVLHQSVAAEDSGFRGLQLTIDGGHPEFSMIHFWPGNAVRVRASDRIATGHWTHLAVTHDGSGRASGIRLFIDGRIANVEVERDGLTRDIRHRKEWGDMKVGQVKLAIGARFRDIGLRDGLVDELKVFDKQLSTAEVQSLHCEVRPDKDFEVMELEPALEHQWLTADESVRAAKERLQQAREDENEIVTNVREIMTMKHLTEPPATYVLQRGDYTAKGEQVHSGTPEFLSEVPSQGDDRLALASWLTDPRNPLTSRVISNRLWHLFFGRGIVVTLEDLGSQGRPLRIPSCSTICRDH